MIGAPCTLECPANALPRIRSSAGCRAGRWTLLALLLTGCLAPRAGAQSSSSAVKITGLRAGFAGRFKVGYWAPFEVLLEGAATSSGEPVRGRVELTVLDGDGVPSRVRAPGEEITVAPAQQTSVALVAKVGQLKSDIVVSFHAADGTVATRQFSTTQDEAVAGIMPSGDGLIVTIGGPLLAADKTVLDKRGTRVAALENVAQLPSQWWGLEGVDAVIVAIDDDATAAQLSADDASLAALDEWVRMGGRLVLSVGSSAERVLDSASPLAKLVPGAFESLVTLREHSALETYAETSEPLFAGAGAQQLQVPRLTGVRGKIEAYAGGNPRDLPLVVRASHGFGEIVFVAADLGRPPLSTWAARSQFLDKLLRHAKAPAADKDQGALGQVTTLGFVDLTGQLRGALDQFTGIGLAPFWLVVVLVLAYIGCIGPLDYWIVKRVLGRMELTWLTFAITVLAFSGGAYALAYGLKGRERRVNQVDLVDFDVESRQVRGTTWVNLFSPENRGYDLSLEPAPLAEATASSAAESGAIASTPRVLFSWLGLPGVGFGGMNAPSGSLPEFTQPYDFSPALDALERVPVAVWSSKAFVGRWSTASAGAIEAELSDRGKLVGTLVSQLDAPLNECVLLYDRWAYPLRQLKPGERIDIDAQLDPQTIDTFLRHVTVRGDRDVAPPYDRASFDVPRIVEIMSTYELAGGEKYTGLANTYQAFVDLSPLVKNGRAVLIGRRAAPAAGLVCDGQVHEDAGGSHWTFYRYVFPVQQPSGP